MLETVVDLKQLREMLHHFDTLHIAFQDDEYPYIVPMNFGIGDDEDKIVLYIYTPREGKMTRLIKENPHVGIQAETLYEFIVIIIFSISQYQFLPCLYILQFLSKTLFLQYSTTSFVFNFRFFIILLIPISVICTLFMLSSNICLSSIT